MFDAFSELTGLILQVVQICLCYANDIGKDQYVSQRSRTILLEAIIMSKCIYIYTTLVDMMTLISTVNVKVASR